MWYRVLKRLSTGQEVGELVCDSDLAAHAVAPLLKRGVITEAHLPPLSALNGWEQRAERCAELGIYGAGEFLGADATELATMLGEEPAEIVRRQAEVVEYVVLKPVCTSGKCRRK